jgi:hypothetical protein
MSSGLIQHLALVSQSNLVGMSDLAVVSAALQKQVIRDFAPLWAVNATVDAFESLDEVPLDYWPMVVKDDIGFDAAGIHLDKDGQPFALITAEADRDVWSLTASHECLEILADPFGNRTVAGDSPKPDQDRVMFLVEVCDPSEAAEFGYSINGVLVSDFYTPNYFDPIASTAVRYSFTGAIKEPRDVLAGGYLSWLNPVSGEWWQETWFSGTQSSFRSLGKLDGAKASIRSQIDRMTARATQQAIAPGRKAARAAGLSVRQARPARDGRAASLQAQIDALARQSEQNQQNQQSPRSGGGRKAAGESERRRRPKRFDREDSRDAEKPSRSVK